MEKTPKIILILSLIGLITSLYLFWNHYSPPQAGAICDFSKTFSCSSVNTSKYAELLNVPLSLLGVIWFLFLLQMTYLVHKDISRSHLLLVWSLVGVLFVGYLLLTEFLLRTICPFCTIIHIIVIAVFLLSYRHYRQIESKPHPSDVSNSLKKWAVIIFCVYFIVFVLFNSVPKTENYDTLAKCLTAKNVTLYGSYLCSHCLQQQQLFGPSLQYLHEVECHPQGPNSQWQLCQKKNVEATPTWTKEIGGIEVKRHEGYMTVESLRLFSGCEG